MTVERLCVRRISAQLFGTLMLASIPLQAAEKPSTDKPSLDRTLPLDLGALHAERRRRQGGASTQPGGPSRTVIINGEVVAVSEPLQPSPPQADDANHSQASEEEHAPTPPPPPPPSAFELTLEWFGAGLNHAATWRDLAEVSRSLQAAYPALASECNSPGFEEFEYQIAAAFAERMQNLLSLTPQKQPRAAFLPLEALPDFVSGRANFMLANLRALLFAHGLKQNTQTPAEPPS